MEPIDNIMKYLVRLINNINKQEHVYECKSLKEANKVSDDLKTAFLNRIKTGEILVIISNK